jgi:hypothetical protein
MAVGWSPLGWKGLTTSKGATVRSMSDTGRMTTTVRPATDNRRRTVFPARQGPRDPALGAAGGGQGPVGGPGCRTPALAWAV